MTGRSARRRFSLFLRTPFARVQARTADDGEMRTIFALALARHAQLVEQSTHDPVR